MTGKDPVGNVRAAEEAAGNDCEGRTLCSADLARYYPAAPPRQNDRPNSAVPGTAAISECGGRTE